MAGEFSTVGVVGLGTMGAGIAEVFARSGVRVVGIEADEQALCNGRGHIERSTERALARGRLDTAARDELLGRITYSTKLSDLAGAALVVEAVPERLEMKARVFTEIDKVLDENAILCTNTSSLSVTEIAMRTMRPGKVVGMHFFNPAPVFKLVEVVRTVVTEPEVISNVVAFAENLGKVPVVIDDRAGFIANALLFGYLNHAVRMYEERHASREDLDAAMRFGCGYPMGPLELLDLIGLDTAHEILNTMYHQSRDRLHASAPLLKQMIAAGLLGRKTGRGFYVYQAANSRVADDGATGSPAATVNPRPVNKIGVIGTGTMATGIIESFTKGGFRVVVFDRISTVVELEELSTVDLIVETVDEELPVKRTVFATLDRICKPGTVLATATPSFPVIECAAATSRPADVVGMHFVNPGPATKLVEVVSTISTASDVVATADEVCRQAGKHPVHCRDRAGFIVNALLFPYLNDAVKMLETHYASVDDIDTAMKSGCGLPMGPFEALDMVGLDTALAIQRALYREFREAGFAPAPLLERLVTAGRLGRKTGKGFRDHPVP